MSDYEERDDYQIAADFFKAPNGTTLFEKGSFSRVALFAIKLPLGGDDRFSVVMADRLRDDQFNEHGICPNHRWNLEIDSYVDNETGTRILCQYSSEFEHILKYKEGISLSHAIDEIEGAVQKQIAAMPDEALILAGHSHGKHLAQSLILSEDDKKTVQKDCEQAFVFDTEPDCYSNTFARLDLSREFYDGAPARFAMSYLNNKAEFVNELTALHAPKHAAYVLHARAMVREAERCMQELEEHPRPELLKERDIRKAIEGKASIWATFGKGEETLRLSVPTAMFHSSKDLNDYALTEKDRRRLRDFLKDPDAYYVWYPHISDIVALDYKGKTLYRDEDFYHQDRSQENTNPSLASILQDAHNRAVANQMADKAINEFTR